MKILDVTGVIVQDDQLVAALYDGREGEEAIAIVKPVEKNGKFLLEVTDPDGLERYQWLKHFGLMSEEQLNEEYKKVQVEDERKKIYEELKKEFDAPRVLEMDRKERDLKHKERDLNDREKKIEEKEIV